MPQIFGKVRNVKSMLPEGHSLFGQNVDDYPRHHFIFPVMSPPPESWGLQVQFAGRDEFIYGCWRERRSCLSNAWPRSVASLRHFQRRCVLTVVP